MNSVKINIGPVSWTQTQSLLTANPAEKAAWMEQTFLRKMQVPAVAQTAYSGRCDCARPALAHGWGEVAQNSHPHIQCSASPIQSCFSPAISCLTKLFQNLNKQFFPLLTCVPVKDNALFPVDRLELPAARQLEQQGLSGGQR